MAFRLITLIAVFFAFCPASACTAVEKDSKGPSKRVTEFMGETAAAVLAEADRVQTYRLKNERAKDGAESIGGYAVVSKGEEMQADFASRLASILFDEGTYLFDSAKGCKFDPGVGYRVWKGEVAIEIVFCFSCDELVIYSPKAEDGSIRSAAEDFDPARAELVRLAKEAFPKDDSIIGLAEAE